MHIQSINNSSPNFNGSYQFKGAWTNAMRELAEPFVQELAKGNKKVIAKMTTTRAIFDKYHRFGQKLYRPIIISRNENLTLLEKIQNMLGVLPKNKEYITDLYHKASSTERLLEERLQPTNYNVKNYCRKLDIER